MDEDTLPALADDIDGARGGVFESELNGMFMTLAPEVKMRAAPAPTSHRPPPMASNALLWAGVMVCG